MNTLEILYGRQPLRECLRAGRRTCRKLWIQSGSGRTGLLSELTQLARTRRIPVEEAERRDLDRMTRNGHHQGVVLEADPYPFMELEDLITVTAAEREPALFLLLDHLQDPQNVGSLLRTADAAGVHGILIPRDRCVDITPAVVRASSGASEHLRISKVPNLRKAILDLRARGVSTWGLEGGSQTSYLAADLKGPLALVVGSEGEGLSHPVRNACDGLLSIPMLGSVDSLNAAIAGAVLLFHIRARRTGP